MMIFLKGYPPGSYPALIVVLHQIHCLKSLHENLIHDYEYYYGHKGGFSPPIRWEAHVIHCMGIVRQELICHADPEPVSYIWLENKGTPLADFILNKQYRDHEALPRY